MIKSEIFPIMMRYHLEQNLEPNLRYMNDGIFEDPEGKKVVPGYYENKSSSGQLVFADGNHTIDDLLEDGVILNLGIRKLAEINDSSEFYSQLTQNKGDGAVIYHNRNVMTKAPKVGANVRYLNQNIEDFRDMFPDTYATEDGSVTLEENLGNRTIAAFAAPFKHNYFDSYVVSQTAYNETGLGIVAHIDHDGVKEMFYFKRQENAPSYLDEKNKIVGIHRTYSKENGKWQYTERIVPREEIEQSARPDYTNLERQMEPMKLSA